MKPRSLFAVVAPLAGATIFAQSPVTETPAHTYFGDVVNANCYQAALIVNRNSRGYRPMATTNAFAASPKPVPNASPKKKKEILRHCSVNPGTTQFALLNDDGNFLRLDEN